MNEIGWVVAGLCVVYLILRLVVDVFRKPPEAIALKKQQQDYLDEVARVTKEIQDAKIKYDSSRKPDQSK